jgi:hypothetical protein
MTQEVYVEKRMGLIPIAEKAAYAVAGPRPPGPHEEWAVIWNWIFHAMMDVLAMREGLIGGKYVVPEDSIRRGKHYRKAA